MVHLGHDWDWVWYRMIQFVQNYRWNCRVPTLRWKKRNSADDELAIALHEILCDALF